jgi:hypothetical protein
MVRSANHDLYKAHRSAAGGKRMRWARRGIWENLFRQLAGNGRCADTQMIDSTQGAKAGGWPLAGRAEYQDPRTRGC